jgi:capsular exopolysaccharide synthesis family protein
MQETVNNSKNELWSLSFRDLFYKYVRFLPLFILSVAVALFIAFIYLRYSVPVYSVGGTMLIKNEQQGGGRGDKFEDVFVNTKALNIASEIEILKSRPLMQRVVDSLNLQFSYYGKGKIKTVNIYKQGPFLLNALEIADSSRSFSFKVKFINDHEFRINDEKKTFTFGQVFKNSNGVFRIVQTFYDAASSDYSVMWQPSAIAATSFAGGITVTPKVPGTGILNVGMQTANSQMGADIINKLMQEYSYYSVEEKKKSSEQILTFIDDRLNNYGHILDSVQRIQLNYEQRHNLIDAETQLARYFNNIGESDKASIEQTYKFNTAEGIDEYLKNKKNEYNNVVVPSSLGLDDITLNELVTAYNKAQIERQQLLDANVPPKNPAVLELGAQIEKLRISIKENLKNIKSSLGDVISSMRKRTNVNEAELKSMPVQIKELAEIKRQVETYQNLYKYLQQKKEETAITIASAVSNSGIINKAFPSNVPVKPNRKAIQILAILLGIGLPALFIFIGEILNDKVTTRFDIEKITSAPILGEIGHSYSDKVLVVDKTTRSMVAEQFRIIRSNLQYILTKKDKSTILVTSSFSGEGKSYVTTNMGAVLALAGKKTIILEFDIRKPKILSGLGIAKGPGLTNFLVGKANLADLVRQVPDQENLFVLGCGPIPPNPAELLLDQKVEELFAWLRENFDIILVDTAPVGMVSDAMTLSKFADSTLYLVRQGHTFKKQIALIDEFYRENKLPKVSIIVNDVKIKAGYGYYGYGRYGYGYGYGYGSYYEEETPPRSFFERALGWLDVRRFFRKPKKNR